MGRSMSLKKNDLLKIYSNIFPMLKVRNLRNYYEIEIKTKKTVNNK